MEENPRRRWLRVSIRDLAWLTLVVAILFAWWMDRASLKHTLEFQFAEEQLIRAVEANRNVPGTVPEVEVKRLMLRYNKLKASGTMSGNGQP